MIVQKRWIVLQPCATDIFIQIIPENDEKEHSDKGDVCWCKPRVEVNFKDGVATESPIVLHNSADMRELIERAEEIKDQTL